MPVALQISEKYIAAAGRDSRGNSVFQWKRTTKTSAASLTCPHVIHFLRVTLTTFQLCSPLTLTAKQFLFFLFARDKTKSLRYKIFILTVFYKSKIK